MSNNISEIRNFKLPCFDCFYGHNCKYYSDQLWVDYMIRYERTCPAIKYPYSSIYYSILEYKEEQKRRAERFSYS